MDKYLIPMTTNAAMVRVVPDQVDLHNHGRPAPIIHFSPRGTSKGILICGGSSRTHYLFERIYGRTQEIEPHGEPTQAPTLLINEGDYLPSFDVDTTSMIISISGPIVTIAQLKVSIRYLTACAAIAQSPSLVPIHGSLLSLGDSALLICGLSGSGKSWLSEDLIKKGGLIVVDDWALYESGSRLCMLEDEQRILRRGGLRTKFPPWIVIEEFDGDPHSSQSRYMSISSETELVQYERPQVTHLLILDEPLAANVMLLDQHDPGTTMRHMRPNFMDEAISILGQPQSNMVEKRLNTLGAGLDSKRLTGYRTSIDNYQKALSLISTWLGLTS